MSGAEEERKRAARAEQVALFRYQLIREAADPALSTRQRGRMVREIVSGAHEGPFGEPVTVSRSTVDRWIRAWQEGGFPALVPPARQVMLRTDAEVLQMAAGLKRENPARTAAQIRRILCRSCGWSPSVRTLQRHFERLELRARPDGSPPAVFGRFESSGTAAPPGRGAAAPTATSWLRPARSRCAGRPRRAARGGCGRPWRGRPGRPCSPARPAGGGACRAGKRSGRRRTSRPTAGSSSWFCRCRTILVVYLRRRLMFSAGSVSRAMIWACGRSSPSSRPQNRVCHVRAACLLAGAGSADRGGDRGEVHGQPDAAAGGADP